MIRHIVFFSAANPEDVDTIRDGLMMLKDIPDAHHFEVGRNLRSDKITGPQVDVVVYAEFTDQAALDAYKSNPIYAACIAKVRPLREMRIAADFEAPSDG
ncbi:Dabb family protein [Roseovarius sp. CAU 1744]|uniref:Dabb family protein n=1 Tax=Roseovarius sp. CAU 1744 TaxID=3140368 RepID=UPI00325B21B1